MENESLETIYIPICQKSNLPKNGWIQSCILCGSYTSKFIFFKEVNSTSFKKIYHIIVCKDCSVSVHKNNKKMKRIYEYAEDFIDLYH